MKGLLPVTASGTPFLYYQRHYWAIEQFFPCQRHCEVVRKDPEISLIDGLARVVPNPIFCVNRKEGISAILSLILTSSVDGFIDFTTLSDLKLYVKNKQRVGPPSPVQIIDSRCLNSH